MPDVTFRHASAHRSADGSPLSGDQIAVDDRPGSLGVVLVDVAGSGWDAGRDALKARARIGRSVLLEPAGALLDLHEAMVGTRGAVGVAARFDPAGFVRFAGVGDVRFRCWCAGRSHGLAVQRGQLGNSLPELVEHERAIEPGDIYVFTTDGIRSRMSLEETGFARPATPASLAERVVADWHRSYDDAACVVVMADAA